MSNKNRNIYMEKRSWKKDIPFIPSYLLMFVWVAFILVTIGWLLIASVSTTRDIFNNTIFEGLFEFGHYINLWVRQNVPLYYFNSILYAVTSCIGIIIIAAPAAYVLSRKVFRGRKAVFTIFMTSLGIPGIMVVLPIYYYAAMWNLIGTRGSMLVVILLYITLNTPFAIFFLSAFFASIPSALEEAAVIDGASHTKAFWKVIVPLTQPALVTLTIFNFIGVWNEFFIALVFANTRDTRTIALGLQAIVQSMRYSGNWAGLFAGVCFVFIPTVIIFIFLSEKIISGITSGAVKA